MKTFEKQELNEFFPFSLIKFVLQSVDSVA